LSRGVLFLHGCEMHPDARWGCDCIHMVEFWAEINQTPFKGTAPHYYTGCSVPNISGCFTLVILIST